MPLTAPVLLGSQERAGSTTTTVSPSRDVQVGEVIVVTLTERDWGISSLADNSAQAGTANTYTQNATSTLLTDPTVYAYSCVVTRKILSTDTITATFAGPNGGKSMAVYALPDANTSGGAAVADLVVVVSGAGAGSTFSSTTSGSSTAQADEYFIGVAAVAQAVQPTSITADSPWTLQFSGVAGGGQAYGHAHGTEVSSTVQTLTYSGGWGINTAGVESALGISFKGTPTGGVVLPPHPTIVDTAVARAASY